MAIQGQKGFTVSLDDIPAKTNRIDQLLFSESKPRFILESRQKNTSRILRRMRTARIPAAKIGLVEGSRVEFAQKSDPMITTPLNVVADSWSRTLEKTMQVAP